MRIGIFTHNYPRTAKNRQDAGIFIYDFAQELAKHAEVFVFCPNIPGKKQKYAKVPVTWFNWGGPKSKFGDWSIFSPASVVNFLKLVVKGQREAVKFAREKKLDYCLAAWSLPSSVFTNHVRKKLAIPYAVWNLGSDINKYAKYPLMKRLIVTNLRQADTRLANSYLLCKKGERLTGKKYNFLPAITDFDPKKIPPKKLSKNTFHFLFIGRLEKVKGIDVLVKACGVLKEGNDNFMLHVLGDGSLLGEMKRQVKKLDLVKNVNFLGNVGKEKVAGYMKSADLLVIPSRNESLPLVLLEAVRCNLPVIATNVGDCSRVVKGYNMGIIVPKENAGKLAKEMGKMVRKKTHNRKYKIDLKKFDGVFSQGQSVNKFLKLVNK